MSHDDTIVTGRVWGIFSHRFAVQTADEKVLADLGPHTLGRIVLREGDVVTFSGRRKPTEVKVGRLVTPDGAEHRIERPADDDKLRGSADPKVALEAVRAAGFGIIGVPHRKPKHWEVEAVRGDRAYLLHVELDGKIRKSEELAD